MVWELVQPFRVSLQAGEFLTDAAAVAGAHRWRGSQWLRDAGGVRSRRGRDVQGRCLSFAEREDVALAQQRVSRFTRSLLGWAAALRRSARELSWNSPGPGRRLPGEDGARAGLRAASRPKPAKLATNLALRKQVEHDLQKRYSPEQIATQCGTP